MPSTCIDPIFKPIEIITIVISIVSLIVSLITVYFSFFRKKLSFIGCLAAYHTTSDRDPNVGRYEFALSNNGNRELLLRDIIVDVTNSPQGMLLPVIKNYEIPVIIKPGQMVLLNIELPKLFLTRIVETDLVVSLDFHIYSTDAKLFIVTKLLKFTNQNLEISPDGWKPFKLGKPFKTSKLIM